MQIYVARWSLRHTIEANKLTLQQLPRFIIESGFQGIELADRDLQGEPESALAEFIQQARQHDCGVILDINCDLTSPEPEQLQSEINYVTHWLEKARQISAPVARISLGGQSISVAKLLRKSSRKTKNNTGSDKPGLMKRLMTLHIVRITSHKIRTWLPVSHRGVAVKIDRAIATLQPIIQQAEKQNIRLGIENHWGISALPQWINQVVEKVNSPWLGVCVDFGNFPTSIPHCEGVCQLMPHAVHVQAKSWHFDADGEEQSLDFRCLIEAVKTSGYDGPITIEYEGNGDDLVDCRKTAALIRRYWNPQPI